MILSHTIMLLFTISTAMSSADLMQDITNSSGIELSSTSGTLPSREILEVNGGGLALLDYDSDGDLDLFVANGATLADPEHGPGSRLYENISSESGILFKDVTPGSGIRISRWAMGAAAGDHDGDGQVDLYVTCYGPNILLRNLGDGTFEDATEQAGVGTTGWSTSAAFGDLDADGDLDLFVVNYLEFDHEQPPARSLYKGHDVMGGPHGLPATGDVLFENIGDGRFRNATESSGLAEVEPAYGLNLAILDMNGDGHLDVLVGNDSMPNHLLLQEPGGDGIRLAESGQSHGIASNMDGHDQATMGIAVGDINGDARPDFFTTNFSSDTNTLHLAAPDGLWDDRTMATGLGLRSRSMLGWGTAFADLDHDGDEDLLMVNGHVYPQATLDSMDSEYLQPPVFMERDGSRFKTSRATEHWLATPHRDRTLVTGDLDRDGDLDLIIGELNGPVRILQNNIETDRRGVIIGLLDEREGAGDRYAPGARLVISAGDEKFTRWIPGGACFQSTMPPEVHISIPPGIEMIDVEVSWPSGERTAHKRVPVSNQILLRRTD